MAPECERVKYTALSTEKVMSLRRSIDIIKIRACVYARARMCIYIRECMYTYTHSHSHAHARTLTVIPITAIQYKPHDMQVTLTIHTNRRVPNAER